MRWSAILLLVFAATASAQDEANDAIVLSIESSDRSIDPDALREALAARVALPVVGLAGTEAPVALVVVSVRANGDASVIATAQGTPRMHTIARSNDADWLQDGLVAIVEEIKEELTQLRVETIRRRERYALMSWNGGLRPRREPRLLRPWPWEAGRPAPVRPSRVGGEVGSALSAPSPAVRQHQRFD